MFKAPTLWPGLPVEFQNNTWYESIFQSLQQKHIFATWDWLEGETVDYWGNIINKQFVSKVYMRTIYFIIIKMILEYNQVGKSAMTIYMYYWKSNNLNDFLFVLNRMFSFDSRPKLLTYRTNFDR